MYIQKILPYDVYAKTTGTSRYMHVSNLLNQTVDPETMEPNSLDCAQQTVFTSPRRRALSCLKEDSASSVIVFTSLNEITFSLQEFCDEESFFHAGSTAVRKAFVDAFIEDKLGTSHKQIHTELENILLLRNQIKPPLCISHTFRMKLLEIYANIGDALFQKPSIIKDYIDCGKHLYKFGEIIEI